jgi:hypothetical protein
MSRRITSWVTSDWGRRTTVWWLAYAGLMQLFFGIAGFAAPTFFYDTMAKLGERNDYFVYMVSSLDLAMGLGLLISAKRPSWRIPVLTICTVHWGLHSLSHAIDIKLAAKPWVGTGYVWSIASGAFGFLTLLWVSIVDERAKRAELAKSAETSPVTRLMKDAELTGIPSG